MKRYCSLIIVSIALVATNSVAAPEVAPAAVMQAAPLQTLPLDEKKAADIARVEAYLSSLTTIRADFTQVSADGSTGSGQFFLRRPGKMRWQYNPPNPILLISNGATVTYYDASLAQVSYVPVDDTLAGFLAQKTITLESPSTHLTQFSAADGVVRATLVQKKKPTEGSLTLEFADAPLQLRQMTVVDALGQSTHIQLQNAQFGPVLEDALFVFKDPRGVVPRKSK